MEEIRTRHGFIITETQGCFGSYCKEINEKQHKFNKFNGYGFSNYEIEDMKRYLVNKICIKLTKLDGKKVFLFTNLDVLLKKGKFYNHNGDSQLILESSFFVVKEVENND